MFATLASFLFGSSKTEEVSNDSETSSSDEVPIQSEPLEVPQEIESSMPHNSFDNNCLEPMTLAIDDLNDLRMSPRMSPEPVLSMGSLSEEEAGWVFVDSKEPKSPKADPQPTTVSTKPPLLSPSAPTDKVVPYQRPQRRAPPSRSQNAHQAVKSKMFPTSGHKAAANLALIAANKPPQKSQRRQKELRLKRRQLERLNLVNHVLSSSNRPSPRRRCYAPDVTSRVSNNRKC